MMPRKPKPIAALMRKSAPLERLRLELAHQARILRQLGADLPAELAPHLLAARVKGSELLIYLDTPAWATRLRFLAPQVLRAARRVEPTVSSVAVRVSVMRQPAPSHHAIRPISPAAAAVIGEAGAQIEDEALRAALLRLASRGRN
jgi:hypothetical protein